MKKKLFIAAVVLVVLVAACWHWRRYIALTLEYYGLRDSYYTKKVKEFRAMPQTEGSIVFLGDSITDFVNFPEVLPSYDIVNHGIRRDTTSGVLHRLGEVVRLKPRKLFLLIGTNDIGQDIRPANIAQNIREIVSRVQSESPGTKIYLQAVFPTRHFASRPNALIQELNAGIRVIADEMHCTFIDLYPLLLDDEGELAQQFTIDGLHLSESAVAKWMAYIVPYLDE